MYTSMTGIGGKMSVGRKSNIMHEAHVEFIQRTLAYLCSIKRYEQLYYTDVGRVLSTLIYQCTGSNHSPATLGRECLANETNLSTKA
jgi:hypothetical protein